MSFQQIIGQSRVKQMLRNSLRSGAVSHAYLFSGPPGCGKRQMAYAFAQAILCPEREDDACGACVECRKVEHRNHPHLFVLEPEGRSIKIEQIRQLQQQFQYRPGSQQKQVYIIFEAEKMTVQAANSLLKFLEEPASLIVAILVTDNGHAVLPTIQSRVQSVLFAPMAPQEMQAALEREGHPPLLVLPAVHIASGLEEARKIVQRNEFAEMRNRMIQLAKESLANYPASTIFAFRHFVKTELIEHIDLLLHLFLLWFKDLIHIQCGREKRIVFIDQIDWLKAHAHDRQTADWIRCMEYAQEARKRIKQNANPQLTLEHFLARVKGGEICIPL
jgi:DNA polymerase-3 subunit delta'